MQVKELAARLGVSPATIRNWSGVFSEFLSANASPPKGHAREYTQDDLQTLAAVAHYKKTERLTYDQIKTNLTSGTYGVNIPIPDAPPPETPETALVPIELVQALYVQIARLEDRLLEREQDLQTQLQEAQRERGRLEGRLQELQSKQAKTWLDRLLGR